MMRGSHFGLAWSSFYSKKGGSGMPFNLASTLWPNGEENFFRERSIVAVRQQGPRCVSTVLGMLSGQTPESFQHNVNTQDPVSWSAALAKYGMKLAYCPTDVRRLKFYLPELIKLDDLFTLSFYSPTDHSILEDPNEDGWVCGSHIVILHRENVIDPALGNAMHYKQHHCIEHFTKRIFRVVPLHCLRGL
jgi:hypothetical protein